MLLQHAQDDGIGDHVRGLLDVPLGIFAPREMSWDLPVTKTVVDALVNVTQYAGHSQAIRLARSHAHSVPQRHCQLTLNEQAPAPTRRYRSHAAYSGLSGGAIESMMNQRRHSTILLNMSHSHNPTATATK